MDNCGLHGGEGLQRTEVGRRLDKDFGVFVDQDFGNQIQRLLAAGGDQDLRRVDAPRQSGGCALAPQVVGDPLAQRRIAFAGGILQPSARCCV